MVSIHPQVIINFIRNSGESTVVNPNNESATTHFISEYNKFVSYRPENHINTLRIDVPTDDLDAEIGLIEDANPPSL